MSNNGPMRFAELCQENWDMRQSLAAKDREIAALREALREISLLDTRPYIQIGDDPNFPGETIQLPGQIAKIAIAALSASPAPDRAPNDATRLARAFNAWTPPAPDPAKSVGSVTHIPSSPLVVDDAIDPDEAMSDGAIYAAVSRAKDPEAYDKMLDEVTADARAVLAAEDMRAKWEPVRGLLRRIAAGEQTDPRQLAQMAMAALDAALKGNGEGT